MALSRSLSPSIFLDTHMSTKPTGLLKGKGTATSDSIPAQLSKGEYVIPAAVVKHYGVNYFKKLSESVPKPPDAVSTIKKGMPHLAGGGEVEDLLKAKKPNFTMQPNYEGTIPPNRSLVPTAWRNVNNKGKISDTPGYKGFSNADIDNAEKFKQSAQERVSAAKDNTAAARPTETPIIDTTRHQKGWRGAVDKGLKGLGSATALSTSLASDILQEPRIAQQRDNAISGLRTKAGFPIPDAPPSDFVDTARDFTARNIIEPVMSAFKSANQRPQDKQTKQVQQTPNDKQPPQVRQTQPSLEPASRQPLTANPVAGIQTPSTLSFDNGRKTLAGQGYSLSATGQKQGQSTPESLTALDKTLAYNATPEAKAQFAANAAINNERAERSRAFDAEHAPSVQPIQPQVADYSGAINDAEAQLNWLAQTGPMGNSHSDKKQHQQQLAAAQAQLASLMGLQGGAQEQGLGMARLAQDAQQRAQSNQLAQQQLQYGAQRDQQAGLAAAEQQNYERQRNRQNDNKLIPKTVTKVDDKGIETQEVKFFNPLTGEEVLSPRQQQENKNTQISANAHDIINNPDNPAHQDPAKIARAKAWFATPAGKTWLAANAQ
jgi:hypothetical protein